MPLDPNSFPRIEPLEPSSTGVIEQKITGLLTYQHVGTGSNESAGVMGSSYGHGSNPEVID
jgi:hypothetical protein